jgi:hypothetical protein
MDRTAPGFYPRTTGTGGNNLSVISNLIEKPPKAAKKFSKLPSTDGRIVPL